MMIIMMAMMLVLMMWLILKITILLKPNEFKSIFLCIKIGSEQRTEKNVYTLCNLLQGIIFHGNYARVRDYTKLVIQKANNLKGDVVYNSYLKEAHKLEEREINGLKVE